MAKVLNASVFIHRKINYNKLPNKMHFKQLPGKRKEAEEYLENADIWSFGEQITVEKF